MKGWQRSRFTGYIKQNVDILKEARAYQIYQNEGWIDRDQAANELTGADHATVVKRLNRQNPKLAAARETLFGTIQTSKSKVEATEPSQPNQPKPNQPNSLVGAIFNCGFDAKVTGQLLVVVSDPTQKSFRQGMAEALNVRNDIDDIDDEDIDDDVPRKKKNE